MVGSLSYMDVILLHELQSDPYGQQSTFMAQSHPIWLAVTPIWLVVPLYIAHSLLIWLTVPIYGQQLPI